MCMQFCLKEIILGYKHISKNFVCDCVWQHCIFSPCDGCTPRAYDNDVSVMHPSVMSCSIN